MKLIEHFNALFPYDNYYFPEGIFEIIINNKKPIVQCTRVVLLKKILFDLNDELKHIYSTLFSNQNYFTERYPYKDDYGILIKEDVYNKFIERMYSDDKDQIVKLQYICDAFFCLCLSITHELADNSNAIEYINTIRDEKGIEKAQQEFFSVIDYFYKYITIQRAPYINVTDIHFWNIHGMFAYFCKENMELITKVRPIKYDCWEPRMPELGMKAHSFFRENKSISLEDYFIAQSKVYLRLRNYAMAIVYGAMALEITVPEFLNAYLKYKKVDSDSINDFKNKFGLSVRVKAILKLILPQTLNTDIMNAGILIGYRNDVLHRKKISDYFRDKNIDKLLESCEKLSNKVKKEKLKLEATFH